MPHNPNIPQIRGALFENSNPNGPAMSGFVEVDGNRFYISCWPATAQKTGDPYFRVSADDLKNTQNGIRPLAPPANQGPSRQLPPQSRMAPRPSSYQPQGNPNITTGPRHIPRQQQQAPRSPDDMDDDSIPF